MSCHVMRYIPCTPSQPLKRNVESSFRTDGAAMLKIRNDNMAENALRAASEAIDPRYLVYQGVGSPVVAVIMLLL